MEDPDFTIPLKSTSKTKISPFLAAVAIVLIAISGFQLLETIYFVHIAKTGIGHIESVIWKHRDGGVRRAGWDVYYLKIKYLQPPLEKVVSATCNNNEMWGADEMVTFLYNPDDTTDVKMTGFLNLYWVNLILLMIGIGLSIGWFVTKQNEEKMTSK